MRASGAYCQHTHQHQEQAEGHGRRGPPQTGAGKRLAEQDYKEQDDRRSHIDGICPNQDRINSDASPSGSRSAALAGHQAAMIVAILNPEIAIIWEALNHQR
jgi:hypothetical protein